MSAAAGHEATGYPWRMDALSTVDGPRLSSLASLLRCIECGQGLVGEAKPGMRETGHETSGALICTGCAARYPIIDGSPCMLEPALRSRLGIDESPCTATELDASRQLWLDITRRTATSFAYEWRKFGHLRDEWEMNFQGYMQPHPAERFRGSLFLDLGAGSGRHSYEAYRLGARVVAVDVGDAVHVARRNLPSEVLTVQADAERLPFQEGAFDFVAAIGVLHHLDDPARALRSVARYARPGGWVQMYVYWQPPYRWHRALLQLVGAARTVTTRMPLPLLRLLCYPVAALAFASFVVPHRGARRFAFARRLTEALPLKTYADYPFSVCVNDQFDRLSAPLEHRYTAEEVRDMMISAGLEDVVVLPNTGWVACGRRPAA